MYETNITLKDVEIVVYDEADRLFELGFSIQLRIFQKYLPKKRQVMLFSATLPKCLTIFTCATLNQPLIIRLDTKIKISSKLENQYILSREEEKCSVLIYLLTKKIHKFQQIILFAPTHHHLKYLSLLLEEFDISNVIVCGTMEYLNRKINVKKFRSKEIRVMIVTDLASRGIDISSVDNVINFNIPTCPKSFIHRVGRVARSGNYGCAWNLVSPSERSYMCDLFRYLNLPLKSKVEKKKY